MPKANSRLFSAFFIVIPLLVLGCSGTNEANSGRMLAQDEYIDPQALFSIIPPHDWSAQEYPEDSQGRVTFQKTTNLELRILTTGVEYSDISSLQDELPGIGHSTSLHTRLWRTEFNGMPAIVRDSVLPDGAHVLMIDFVHGRVVHSLAYSAPRAEFDTHLNSVMASWATYQPNDGVLTADEELKAYLEKSKRLGRLLLDQGNYDEARFYIEDGLARSATDVALLELLDELMN